MGTCPVPLLGHRRVCPTVGYESPHCAVCCGNQNVGDTHVPSVLFPHSYDIDLLVVGHRLLDVGFRLLASLPGMRPALCREGCPAWQEELHELQLKQ